MIKPKDERIRIHCIESVSEYIYERLRSQRKIRDQGGIQKFKILVSWREIGEERLSTDIKKKTIIKCRRQLLCANTILSEFSSNFASKWPFVSNQSIDISLSKKHVITCFILKLYLWMFERSVSDMFADC